jgi:hypothetical protein
MKTMRSPIWFLLPATLMACEPATRLETRTFMLEHLSTSDAAQLIDPYVYHDREGAPGTLSAMRDAITIRETAENLARIEEVLGRFDTPRPDVRLRFQLIEADGYTGTDERIAHVEQELRKILQFEGYRLSGEAFVTATDGTEFQQTLSGNGGIYQVAGEVRWVQGSTLRLGEVRLYAPSAGPVLTTTVNIRPGQTLILGSSSRTASAATLLLTVSAESS